MRKLTALLVFLFIAASSFAQQSLLLLKKKNKTIKTWSTGGPIEFTLKNGTEINGVFLRTQTKDSIIVRTFQIQRFESSKGFIFFDTLHTGTYIIGLDEIKTGRLNTSKKFAYRASEYTAYTAAAVFATMALVNGAKFDDKFSTSLKQAGVRGGGLFLLGRLFHLLGKDEYKLGSKYRMVVIDLD